MDATASIFMYLQWVMKDDTDSMGSGISVLEGDRWDSWKYAVRRKFSHFPAAHFIRFLAFSLRFTYYSLLRILGGASNAERLASQTGA